jgi:hypothetical protein
LNEQRNELEKLFAEQSYRLQELSELNRQANDSTQDRIGILESVLYDKLNTLEIQIQSQQKNIPQPNV